MRLLLLLIFQSVQLALLSDVVPKIARITDIKQLKALLKAKSNVLVYYHVEGAVIGNQLIEVAENIYGKGTIAFAFCDGDDKEAKKMCKTMKVKPEPFVLRHYSNGDFHKDYDREINVKALTRFMLDPSGEVAWADESAASDVIHINSEKEFIKCINRHEPTLFMFYAPWCGHCKTLKPVMAEIATELKGSVLIAAIDMTNQANEPMGKVYEVKGYPTLHYFEKGAHMWPYEGKRDKESIVKWLKKPMRAPIANEIKVKTDDASWSEDSSSLILHLDEDSFDDVIKNNKKVLAVFYAPWCGHCKRLRPVLENVVKRSKIEGHSIVIVAVDGTKSEKMRHKYGVSGYPNLKFFSGGSYKYDVKDRNEEKLMQWMRRPEAPPPPAPDWRTEKSDVIHLGDDSWIQLEERKHALVMFYAPWCSHCTNAKPEFTEAAKMLRGSRKFLIGAVDCTREKKLCQDQLIGAYPKFKYYRYGQFEADYKEARSRNHFAMFLQIKEDARDEL